MSNTMATIDDLAVEDLYNAAYACHGLARAFDPKPNFPSALR